MPSMTICCLKIWLLLSLVNLSLAETTATPANITILASITSYYQTFYCVIANDSSALTWVTSNLKENPISLYTSGNVDVSCNMNPANKCTSYWIRGQWRTENSLYYFTDPIFDHRWEKFKIIETGDDYKQIIKNLDYNKFEIVFSIRIEKDAYIYLCDGEEPPNANCYWFILGGWEGLVSVVRKCAMGQIPESPKAYPDSPCKDARDERNDTIRRVAIDEWTHFVLRGNQRTYTLTKLGENGPLLTYTDRTRTAFQPKHLIIKSRKGSEGIWKFHLYPFLLTPYEHGVQLGPWIIPQDGTICLALFMRMCSSCRLHLTLTDSMNNNHIVHKQQYEGVVEWTEIKFSAKNLANDNYGLNVITQSDDPNRFWALGDVRRCTDDDVRTAVIKYNGYDINTNYACYSIGLHSAKINVTNLKRIETSDSTCPEETFGASCIPCGEILSVNSCKQHAVCEFAEDGRTRCTCSAGYHGKKCEATCQDDFYGFGCRQSCGHCYYEKCDYITGRCNPCEEGYTGDRCKIPRVPVLKYPPIINASHTSASIQLQNSEYQGQFAPTNYIIYYKNDGQNRWRQTSEYPIDDLGPKEIWNLTSDANYTALVALRPLNDNYQLKFVTIATFTTTCAGLKREDITIRPSNISAHIDIQTWPETCPLRDFQLFHDSWSSVLTSGSFNVPGLMPYTQYNVSLYALRTGENLLISFTTLEGKPTKVLKLGVSGRTATEITITWEPPKLANGIIGYYRVSYKHHKHLGCKNDAGSDEFIRKNATSDRIFEMKDLIPYSEYIIQVVGLTSAMEGDTAYIAATTLQEDVPNDGELPSLTLHHQLRYTRVSLKQEKCEKRRGPLTYRITLCCSNEWCDCQTKNSTTGNVAEVYVDFTSSAYSNYSLEVRVQRTNGSYLEQKLTQDFLSPPTAPHSVQNLTLYSKTENSASLRWLRPYPPTGVLKDYVIDYKCVSCWNGKDTRIQIVAGDWCKLWPEFMCATITIQDHKGYDFLFDVFARNEDPENDGQSSFVNGKLAVERPESPKNLTADWDDYHNLTLSWIHPDVTNGPLTGFVIKVTDVKANTFAPQEQLLYTYAITDAPAASNLWVTVTAKTSAGKSPPTRIETYSPPQVPKFSSEPFVQEADNHTLSMIIPPPIDLVEDSVLYVIVTDVNTAATSKEIPKRIEESAEVDRDHFSWIADEVHFEDYKSAQRKVIIGLDQVQKSKRLELNLYNRPLKMGANYTVTFLLLNTYMNKTRSSVKKIPCKTAGMYQEGNGINYLGLLGLLVLPLLCFLGFVLFRKHKISIRMPVRPIMENLRGLGGNRSNPDVIPLAEAEQPQTRLQPIRPKPKPPTAAKPTVAATISIVGGSKFSRLIKLVDFEAYVREAIETGELERQHAMFLRGQTHPWEQGTKPYNKTKNRYNNLAAYDHTRVKLEMIDGNVTSDYINANYIEGYNVSRAYIATQGPKLATVDDFWRMIWQEGAEYIIMLANVFENGKKKVEKYWPDINQTLEFGPVQVHYVSVDVFADYESRKFSVTCDGQERKVKQLHFMSWPDHGVPLYAQSLVPLLRKMLTIPHGKSPVVVHCSAGVGRTGTIILCDICLRMAAREGEVDVLYHQHKIREQRVNMVDNIEQYKLVHLVLLQCLIAPQTNLACTEEIGVAIEQILSGEAVDFQMKYLDDTAWQDQVMRPKASDEISPTYPHKNRFKDILPDEMSRVFLTFYPTSDETSSYINAVKVDGFQSLSKYIVTQQPLPETLGDFWRLVYEKDISVIISLNGIDPSDKTCCQFWPTETTPTMQPVPYLTVTHSDLMSDANYDVFSAHLVATDAEDGEKRPLKILDFKNWSYDQYHPENPDQLVAAVEEVNRLGKTSKCILVTCHDGARASGLFTALTFVVDKIKLEQECDVCLAVRSVRRSRNEFIRRREQFAFLYEAAVVYVNSFKIYSNFVSRKK